MLEVKASKRTGETNYMKCIRTTLADHYGEKPVAVGGAFLVQTGKVKIHVMVSELKPHDVNLGYIVGIVRFFPMFL